MAVHGAGLAPSENLPLLQDVVIDRIAMRSKLAAGIARVQSNLLSKALQTWIAWRVSKVIPSD